MHEFIIINNYRLAHLHLTVTGQYIACSYLYWDDINLWGLINILVCIRLKALRKIIRGGAVT